MQPKLGDEGVSAQAEARGETHLLAVHGPSRFQWGLMRIGGRLASCRRDGRQPPCHRHKPNRRVSHSISQETLAHRVMVKPKHGSARAAIPRKTPVVQGTRMSASRTLSLCRATPQIAAIGKWIDLATIVATAGEQIPDCPSPFRITSGASKRGRPYRRRCVVRAQPETCREALRAARTPLPREKHR